MAPRQNLAESASDSLHFRSRPSQRDEIPRQTGAPAPPPRLTNQPLSGSYDTLRLCNRTQVQYCDTKHATFKAIGTMKLKPTCLRPMPANGRIRSTLRYRCPNRFGQIRTQPNKTEQLQRLNRPEPDRKNLKEPETRNSPIPRKTLGIRASRAPEKKLSENLKPSPDREALPVRHRQSGAPDEKLA